MDAIYKTLEYAKNAPSGDNSQPWRFKIDGSTVYIINTPEADNKILNFNQRGSLIAHGALIENIIISAPLFGLLADVHIRDKIKKDNVIATIVFTSSKNIASQLALAIPNRSTNRNKYHTNNFNEDIIKTLTNINDIKNVQIILKTEQDSIRNLANAASFAEYVFLTTQTLHKILFNNLVWTAKEERRIRRGLFIDTLELNPAARFMFNFLKYWKIMKIFNRLGLPKIVSKDNAKIYKSSGAIGAIIVPNNDTAFINAGRALGRVWLISTNLQMGLQPLAGVIFLAMRSKNDLDTLNAKNTRLINKANEEIYRLFNVKKGDVIATLFRIGNPTKPPSAKSSKQYIENLILK